MEDDVWRISKCFGKDRFSDRADALSVVRKSQRNSRKGRRKKRVVFSEYRCEYCGGWHITGHRT